MPSEVERFLFGNPVVGHFVERFEYADHCVTIRFRPIESPGLFCVFELAEVLTIEHDATETLGGPLDIIGFDCDPEKEKWRFVLTGDFVEWSWNSQWPTVDHT